MANGFSLGGGNRYIPNEKALRALLTSGQLRPVLRAAAERGKDAAEAASPVASGTYQQSFEIKGSVGWDGRASVELWNTADHALAVEYSNRRSPKAHHVLASVIDIIERG